MLFGKRTFTPQDSQHSESHPSPGAGRAGGGYGVTAGDLGIGAAVLIAVFVGSYGLMHGFSFSGRSITAPAATPVAVSLPSEPVPRARAYDKTGDAPFLVGDHWVMTLKMQKTADGFDAIDSELHERCMKPVNKLAARYAEKKGVTFLAPEPGAEFLACSMRIYRSRFCKDQYRDRLVARLNEFVRARRDRIAMVENMRQTEAGRLMIEISRARRDRDSGITAGYKPTEFVPEPLAEQLHSLSAAGYISQADFGGLLSTVPEQLEPYLEAEAKASPCS